MFSCLVNFKKHFFFYYEIEIRLFSMLLDKRYRSECHMNGIKVVFPSANRYDSLLKQRHIQVRINQAFFSMRKLCFLVASWSFN